jgi:hypothetical protein
MQLYLSCRGADLSCCEEERRRHPPLLLNMVLSVCWDKVVARLRSIEGERGRLRGTAGHRTVELEWMCWDTGCLVLRRGSAANPKVIQTEVVVPDPAPPNHIVLRRSCRTAGYAKYNGVRDVRGPVICSPLYIPSSVGSDKLSIEIID